jgi:predicted  nucleic acid-binding Zn-ribbon protein
MSKCTHRTIGAVLLALLLTACIDSIHGQPDRDVPELAAAVPQGAPQPTRGADEALLKEVRLIRETLQRVQANAQRERLVVERIGTHGERVERLGRQIAEVRDEIGGIEIHIGQMDERVTSLELQVRQANDPSQRRAFEAELKEMRFTQEAQLQRLDRLRERESAINAELQREERTLTDLEARLEALDRELEAEARMGNQVAGR